MTTRALARALPLCLALVAGGLVDAGAAQEPDSAAIEATARVQGRVLDADSGAPISDALLTLSPLGRRALTDSAGAFLLPDVPPAAYELEVRHIAYGTRTLEVEVLAARTATLDLRLSAAPIAVEPLSVEIEYRPRYLEATGFYERMERGRGQFFDPAFVDRWSVGAFATGGRFMALLHDMTPPFTRSFFCSGPPPDLGAAPGRSRPGPTGPVYIDGRLDRSGLIWELSASEIGAIEVYPHGSGQPGFASSEACGVFVVWTKRWGERIREAREIELCAPQLETDAVTLEGRVRDRFTGVPLPGATVRATVPGDGGRGEHAEEVLADREGRFRVCDLPAGSRIHLRASAAGHAGPQEIVEPGERLVVAHDLEVELSGPGRVVGRVVDRESGRPLAAAEIELGDGGERAVADAQGYFALDEVPPGDRPFEVRHFGYQPVADTVSVIADRTVDVRVAMSATPFELEPIVVTAVRDRRLEMRGFYDRREWSERLGQGVFFEKEAIERRRPVRISHLIGDAQGIRLDCPSSRGCTIRSATARGRRLPGSSVGCESVTVYLDGVRVISGDRGAGVSIDELVLPAEVTAVEVYTGAASIPGEFSGPTAQCGVVAIWTS